MARRLRPGPVTLLVLSIVLGCVAIFVSLEYGARAVDADSRRQEEILIANAIEVRQASIRKSALSVTLWDEAVAKVDRRFDAAWTQSNLVDYLHKSEGYPLVYVLDAQGEMLSGPAQQTDVTLAALRPAVEALTADLRRREARRAPFPRDLPSGNLISTALDASTVSVIEGKTYLLAASLIQPDFGKALPSPRAPILLVGQLLDEAFLQELSHEYLVSKLQLSALPPTDSSLARIPLKGVQGVDRAWLSWEPKAPARQLQGTLFLPRLLAMIFVFTVPLLLLRSAQRNRRVLEKARRQAEAAAEAKSEFLSNMSHEFRTPLTVIIGFGRILEVSPTLADKERSMVSRINAASQTMLEMVNDVLDLARLDSGEPDEAFDEIDAIAVADSAVTLLGEQARNKGLYLTLETVGDLPKIRAPAARLRQVLINLIANALKFTATGGVTVRLSATNDHVALAVRDTGIGIEAAAIDRIFERFAQAEASVTKRYGGTGLGLAISRRLIERMHGRLEVESEVGRGSTFRVVLPR